MYKISKFIKSSDAVSEILGEVLLTGIVIFFFGALSTYTLFSDRPDYVPHAEIQISMDETSGTIYLKHIGGEAINPEELEIIIIANDTEFVLSPENISAKLGSNLWEMGEKPIEINLKGLNKGEVPSFKNGGSIDLFLIYMPSSQVIQKIAFKAS